MDWDWYNKTDACEAVLFSGQAGKSSRSRFVGGLQPFHVLRIELNRSLGALFNKRVYPC
jgi:hypothetical protein